VKKCLTEAAEIISLLFQDLFFHSQVKSFLIFSAEEETSFSAAFCRSFLRRRAHAAAQKRRSEIKRAFRKKAA